MALQLGNGVVGSDSVDIRRRANYLPIAGVLAMSLLTGCASNMKVQEGVNASTSKESVHANTELKGLSADIAAQLEKTRKYLLTLLIQYPGIKKGMPDDIKITPHTNPGEYRLTSEKVFAKVTQTPIIIDINGRVLPLKLTVLLDDETKENTFYLNVLRNGYGIEDGDSCEVHQEADGTIVINNLSREKPVRVADNKES